MEIRDDSKTTFDEAIALSTYSNRHAGVLSYVAIFENLWRQTELYEGLKLHAKAQKEFINVTAHELRTLVQPILGLSQLLPSKTGSIEQYRSLSEDILDATKIESIFVFGNPSLFLLISVFICILPVCISSSVLLGELLLMPVRVIIFNPNIAMIPTIARPSPTLLAIHMPLDHIFSPKITPANNAIHSKFIQPKATITRKYRQQHPRQ